MEGYDDTLGEPRQLRNGYFDGVMGTYWAWPVDGYYDLHHTPKGGYPEGDDVVAEGYRTLAEVKAAATHFHENDEKVLLKKMFGL